MSQTALALYPDTTEAGNVRRSLAAAGHADDQIQILEGETGRASELFGNLALSARDTAAYREGIRRGHALVAVTAPPDKIREVAEIMEKHHTLNLQEQTEQWSADGWHADATVDEVETTDQSHSHTPNPAERSAGTNRGVPADEKDDMIGDNDHLIGEDAEPQPSTVVPDK